MLLRSCFNRGTRESYSGRSLIAQTVNREPLFSSPGVHAWGCRLNEAPSGASLTANGRALAPAGRSPWKGLPALFASTVPGVNAWAREKRHRNMVLAMPYYSLSK